MSEALLSTKFSVEDAEITRKTLVDLRRRIANNEAIPPEELAAGLKKIRIMYGNEANIAVKADKPKKAAKAKKAKVNVDDLLGGLLGGI